MVSIVGLLVALGFGPVLLPLAPALVPLSVPAGAVFFLRTTEIAGPARAYPNTVERATEAEPADSDTADPDSE